MTRFSDEDRERIRGELTEAGHELFALHGFDRTRVSDVTDAAGIGTSTFYQFFDSKEELYLAVLVAERERLFDQLEAAVAEAETPRAEAETILRTTLGQVRSNPLIRRLFVDGEIRRVEAQLDGASYGDAGEGDDAGACAAGGGEGTIGGGDGDAATGFGRVLPQPEEWVTRDDFRIDDPEIVRGLLRSLLFVTQARETPVVPDGTYDAVEETLIETVVAGLFAGADPTEE
ncbi:TetR/AcrR family transcriptional regulator [Halorubrum sp. SD626R]|uniref:TetR/AcrR family transcriptional regulator n=1 Tax=Halorubrum sp. SD626R TaxID=1419722 RepID=UPI000A5AABB4|nr:TetR/AcrR family transcriptional regulator [Halorubrum sp. SD626R]TKX80925.1 TetR/AcrR family transcriptional regulator [Halorubrum sp. SD626R]